MRSKREYFDHMRSIIRALRNALEQGDVLDDYRTAVTAVGDTLSILTIEFPYLKALRHEYWYHALYVDASDAYGLINWLMQQLGEIDVPDEPLRVWDHSLKSDDSRQQVMRLLAEMTRHAADIRDGVELMYEDYRRIKYETEQRGDRWRRGSELDHHAEAADEWWGEFQDIWDEIESGYADVLAIVPADTLEGLRRYVYVDNEHGRPRVSAYPSALDSIEKFAYLVLKHLQNLRVERYLPRRLLKLKPGERHRGNADMLADFGVVLDKVMYNKILSDRGEPTPRDIAVSNEGLLLDSVTGEVISPEIEPPDGQRIPSYAADYVGMYGFDVDSEGYLIDRGSGERVPPEDVAYDRRGGVLANIRQDRATDAEVMFLRHHIEAIENIKELWESLKQDVYVYMNDRQETFALANEAPGWMLTGSFQFHEYVEAYDDLLVQIEPLTRDLENKYMQAGNPPVDNLTYRQTWYRIRVWYRAVFERITKIYQFLLQYIHAKAVMGWF